MDQREVKPMAEDRSRPKDSQPVEDMRPLGEGRVRKGGRNNPPKTPRPPLLPGIPTARPDRTPPRDA